MENSNSDCSQKGKGWRPTKDIWESPSINDLHCDGGCRHPMFFHGNLYTFPLRRTWKKKCTARNYLKNGQKLAVQQQEIDQLRDKVSMISQRLERQEAEEVRDQEVLNCGPVVPDKIEARERQAIECSTQTLKETEANLSFPGAPKQRPENGFQQQRETLHPNTRKPYCKTMWVFQFSSHRAKGCPNLPTSGASPGNLSSWCTFGRILWLSLFLIYQASKIWSYPEATL